MFMNPNLPRLTAASYEGGYRMRVAFLDGTDAVIDLEDILDGYFLGPLRDVDRFAEGTFDREANTIVWPNDADLAPEFLYERALAAQKKVVSARAG